jgi:hypothetical protein
VGHYLVVCDLCNNISNFSYICSNCKGRFCKDHRRSKTHKCFSVKKKSESTFYNENSKKLTYLPNVRLREALEIIKKRENSKQTIDPVCGERLFETSLRRNLIKESGEIFKLLKGIIHLVRASALS